ncbi:MAG: hypothetical protein QNJ51_23895 [Calothrix sp. MO_167.B12]|nr:hypothetical protein [Calothrix sp. MO_167.B12]
MPFLNKLLTLKPSNVVRSFILISFPILVIFVLGLDSPQMSAKVFEGQYLVDILTVGYFFLLLFALRPDRRIMAMIFVPFALIGEFIFSLVFEMYSYRLGEVPIYVPFGHAILFSVGVLISELSFVSKYEKQMRPVFSSLYVILLSAVVVLFQDTLSVIFAVVFLWVLRRKGYQTLYFIMGFLVLYVELLGTAWGCWAWNTHPFNIFWLQTINPPIGAFVCYILADLGVMKITRYLQPRLGLMGTQETNTNFLKLPST